MKLLDPTFEHYADSFLEPKTSSASASGGGVEEGNERERVGIYNEREEEEDDEDSDNGDDGEFDSVCEFANRQALASSAGSIDMQQITSSMESIFDEHDNSNKLISVSCREGDNYSSDNSNGYNSSSNGHNNSNGNNSNGQNISSNSNSSSDEGVYL